MAVSLATAGAAVGAQWLLHVAYAQAPFAPYSFGGWIIRHAPAGAATTAIEHLGHNALPVLGWGTIAGAFTLAILLRRVPTAALGALAALLTAGAAVLDPITHPAGATFAAAAVATAVAAAVRVVAAGPATSAPQPGSAPPGPPLGRRQLVAGGGLLVVGAVLGVQAVLRAGRHVATGLVRADRSARVPQDASFVGILGLSPTVTSRRDHYTVDVDLEDPIVDERAWRLRIHGAIAHDIELSLDDLRAMPTVERLAALSCISNPVGGQLVGNARWTGVPVADLLRLARPRRDARFLEARAADGYAETLPLAVVEGDALVAFGMNGALLPRAHGFPARLRVPSRYGVKNVKWLTELVLLDDAKLGYWGVRGWDRDAVVRTQSRIDTPRHGDHVPRQFTAAGVAWAGDRRVSRVEVSTDDGVTWQRAELEREADPLSWRRWKLDVVASPGDHAVVVRAVDGHGAVQAPDRTPPHPSGATGWHRIVVTVTR